MHACSKGAHRGKCYYTIVSRAPPANFNPEFLGKQDGVPAFFQMPVSVFVLVPVPSFVFSYGLCVTLPVDTTLECIEERHGMPANFQTPRYPVRLQCMSSRGPTLETFFDHSGTHVALRYVHLVTIWRLWTPLWQP